MAFQIKRRGPVGTDLLTEEKFEDAIHVAHGLIKERLLKARITLTNLKTGETLNEHEIEEAALSAGPRKRRAVAA